MLSYLRAWRNRGWSPITAADYRAAWQRWGGSVPTHPDVVEPLSALAGIETDYLGWRVDGALQAAIAVWGHHLALSRRVLKRRGQRNLFDLGNAEIILPQSADSRICLRHRARFVSALHAGRIETLVAQAEGLSLAREPEQYSSKFRYNQRRELRQLEAAGGRIVPLRDFSAQELAALYQTLFEKRWGFAVPGRDHLGEVFGRLRAFMTGSCIFVGATPAAIQILYRVESPAWISVEYINGGVDPDFQALSPGSVLSFINTRDEWEHARALGKPLRYSFGRSDREYKSRWCRSVPAYEVRG